LSVPASILLLVDHKGRLPQDKEMIQSQIQATDAQIDRLVYELYGLNEEEIKIVEGG